MHTNATTVSRQILGIRSSIGFAKSGLDCRKSTVTSYVCGVRPYTAFCHNKIVSRNPIWKPNDLSGNGTLNCPTKNFHVQARQTLCSRTYNAIENLPPVKATLAPAGRKYAIDNPVSQKLLTTQNLEEVVTVLESDSDKMDALTVAVAIEVLFEGVKNEKLSLKGKHTILTSVGVQKLCKTLRRFSPHMDPGDLINGVKLFSKLSAPGNHQTMQILLKLLSKHANSLDLQQLAYMQFLIDKMDIESKSSLSKALEFALPVVFESQLSTQLDRNDPQAICDFLHYATKYKLSDKSVNLLVESALRISDRIPTRLIISLMWSLCDIQKDEPSHEPVVQFCFRRLNQHMEEFKLKDLATIQSKASRKVQKRVPYFYNEEFVDNYCQRVMAKDADVDVDHVLWAVKDVSLLRHVNIELMDKVGELIAKTPSHILNNDNFFVMLVRAMSSCNYKPEKWPVFSSILLEHPSLIKQNLRLTEVSLTLDFLALDLFPENLIRLIYSADGLPLLEEYQSRFHPSTLVLLYNSVKILYPKYNGPVPPISMIENWKELSRASNANKIYHLKAALQTGLGGESYLINGVYHDGLHIDHGIVMRKGGYPVAVNSQSDSQSDCLSSIPKPPESAIVLIKVFGKESYASNTRRLRGVAALELKIIESLGHPVVIVDNETWSDLPDHEKIPYLMQKIRQKMEHLQWNKNWGDVIPP